MVAHRDRKPRFVARICKPAFRYGRSSAGTHRVIANRNRYRSEVSGMADPGSGVSIIAIDDPSQLAAVVALTPGILGEPTAALVLCVDWDRRARLPAGARSEVTAWFDVGAAAENALLAAEGLDLGATPV